MKAHIISHQEIILLHLPQSVDTEVVCRVMTTCDGSLTTTYTAVVLVQLNSLYFLNLFIE